jgi:hypothetical protein
VSFAAGVGRCPGDPARLTGFDLGLLAAMDREHKGGRTEEEDKDPHVSEWKREEEREKS